MTLWEPFSDRELLAAALVCTLFLAATVFGLGVSVVRLVYRIEEVRFEALRCPRDVRDALGFVRGRCVRRDRHGPGDCLHD